MKQDGQNKVSTSSFWEKEILSRTISITHWVKENERDFEESKPDKWKSKVNRVDFRKQFGVQELGSSDTMLEIEEQSEEQERERGV